jgi:hypothetical protein
MGFLTIQREVCGCLDWFHSAGEPYTAWRRKPNVYLAEDLRAVPVVAGS